MKILYGKSKIILIGSVLGFSIIYRIETLKLNALAKSTRHVYFLPAKSTRYVYFLPAKSIRILA